MIPFRNLVISVSNGIETFLKFSRIVEIVLEKSDKKSERSTASA